MNTTLKKVLTNTGAGVGGSAFYDQIQGHDVPTSFDDISKQRALNFVLNAGLVGGGTGLMRKGLSMEGAKGALPTTMGFGSIMSPPYKDLALAGTKPVMELPELFDSLSKNRTNKLLTGGALGLGALGLGMYGLSKYRDHLKDDEGTIEVTLPTKDPNDEETTVKLPMTRANLSRSMRTKIERDLRRRLRAGTKERTWKRDPETGDLSPRTVALNKAAGIAPPTGSPMAQPGSIAPSSTSGAGSTPPPPPDQPPGGVVLPESVRQPEQPEQDPGVDPKVLSEAESNAAQAAESAQAAETEKEYLKLENEKLKAQQEIEAGRGQADLSPALKTQADRAMRAVSGVKAGSTASLLLDALSRRYSVKRACALEYASVKSASAKRPKPVVGSDDKVTDTPATNSLSTPATTSAAGGGVAPHPSAPVPEQEPAPAPTDPTQPTAPHPSAPVPEPAAPVTPSQQKLRESLPYDYSTYDMLNPEQQEEQMAAIRDYHKVDQDAPNWFDRAVTGDADVFEVGEENSRLGNAARTVGNWAATPLVGYGNAAGAYGEATRAGERGKEIAEEYGGYTGLGSDFINHWTGDKAERDAYQEYKRQMEEAEASGTIGTLWNQGKSMARGGAIAGGTAGSLLLPGAAGYGMLGRTGLVGGSAALGTGVDMLSGATPAADKTDSEAYDYFRNVGGGQTQMPGAGSMTRMPGGGYSRYAMHNLNNNPYHNAYAGASDFGDPLLNFGMNTALPMAAGYFGQNPDWNNTMRGMYSGAATPPRNQLIETLRSGLGRATGAPGTGFNQNLWPSNPGV